MQSMLSKQQSAITAYCALLIAIAVVVALFNHFHQGLGVVFAGFSPLFFLKRNFCLGFGYGLWGLAYIMDPLLPQPMHLITSLTTAIAVILVLVGAFAKIRATNERNRRNREALCMNCGYDLRATPEKCPECGWVLPKRIPCPRCALPIYEGSTECPSGERHFAPTSIKITWSPAPPKH